MVCETAKRLAPLFPPKTIWAVTNEDQAAAVRRELRGIPARQILSEPVGRNTAAAIGLAAIHLRRAHGDAVMAALPADSYIADAARYRKLVRVALSVANKPGNLVVMGVPPARPETGYGYVESGAPSGDGVFAVKRFTEKPALEVAREYVASGNYFWNAGMFFWRVSTFLDCLKRFLPKTHEALEELAATIGARRYERALRQIYPHLESISVDYAVMEPATRKEGVQRVFVVPAEVGWSDIGSWHTVYELLRRKTGGNVSAGAHFALDASGNFFWSPKKFVAAIGVHDLVVVETDDALLICPRDRAQDVSRVVKWLEAKKHRHLL